MVDRIISHYRVLEKLGEGGMGVVYRAEDTKLERAVALKFLPAHLLGNEDVRRRFEREAKASAALAHPNVCRVYEIDEAEGKTFLAMELIEGESLDKKIAQGPLKLDEALSIGQQVAKGLEAAHKRGIVHRDIKPENIMVGADGHVTIMDFGLAQLTEASRLTKTDETMGTVAYMSPEQTEGSGTDRRTDIWALGVVLYEMVTGQQPFKGDYDKAVMYSILNEEPEPITALRSGVPMELEVAVNKCIEKRAERRYAAAADLATDLDSIADRAKSGKSRVLIPAAASPSAGALRSPRAVWLPWLLFAFVTLSAFALAFAHFNEQRPDHPVRRFSFTPDSMLATNHQTAAISPNGRHIAFVSGGDEQLLWVRDLDKDQPRPLQGSQGARTPFWSPDSLHIAFATANELKRAGVGGGPVLKICDLPGYNYDGGSWSADGSTILFSSGAGPPDVYEVSALGGSPVAFSLERSIKGLATTNPVFLPQGAGPRAVLYSAGNLETRDVLVKNLDTGATSRLAEGVFPVYSPTGHILYQSSFTEPLLWALPFSLRTLEATGEAFPVEEDAADPSVAEDGTLVCRDSSDVQQQLGWIDRQGQVVSIGQPQTSVAGVALSPNGSQIAVAGLQGGTWDIWLQNVNRGIRTRLADLEGSENAVIWSPDGRWIAYRYPSSQDSLGDIYSLSAEGDGEPQRMGGTEFRDNPTDWSKDGSSLFFNVLGRPNSGTDIFYLNRTGEDQWEPVLFLETEFEELNAVFSPAGDFVGYASNQSGRFEIYVREFPSGANRVQVSENGGSQPRWSHSGDEIFFVEGTALVAARVNTTEGFVVESTERLFSSAGFAPTTGNQQVRYDVSTDGRRFAFVEPVIRQGADKPAIHVIENWFEEFRDRE